MPLIVLEGADAVGKTTQVELLLPRWRSYIQSQGKRLRSLHLPQLGESTFSRLLSRFQQGLLFADAPADPQLVALLYACDRRDLHSRLSSWLSAGDFVLLDRYVASNIAYQCAKLPVGEAREALAQWIEHVEYQLFAMPLPSLTICLDAPLEFSLSQIAQRRGASATAQRDIHEADTNLQREVRAIYRRLADERENFHIVDCAADTGSTVLRPADEIHEEIWDLIASTLH